jgi:hypothetical protein
MTYKPNAILDGMTRDEALASVVQNYNWDCGWFMHKGLLYPHPKDLGIDGRIATAKSVWVDAINAYYDAKEAASKPRWVEPEVILTFKDKHFDDMLYYAGCHANTEIARDNARRKVSAFIKANGGSGVYTIWRENDGTFTSFWAGSPIVGAITCATEELANAVIERYPDELRLLLG